MLLVAASTVLTSAAMADQLLYDNGGINGYFNASPIYNIISTSDSFSLSSDSTLTSFNLGLWVVGGDSVNTVNWSITTGAFSGTTLASGISSPANQYLHNI